MGEDLPLILALIGLFLGSVFVAASETALLRVSPVRVEAMAGEGVAGAARLAALVRRLPEVLNAILLAALLSQIGAATVAGILADRWFGPLGITIASVLLTVVLFIYSEAIPKTFAVRHSDRVALLVALPVSILELLLRPVVKVLVVVADLQMPGKGIEMTPTVTENELRMLADLAAQEGQITGDDLQLIERAFRVGDRRVDDIMVPRPDIVSVAGSTPAAEALTVALEAGHRRLPVFEGTVENITGVVSVRDLMRLPADRRPVIEVGVLALEPLVVPESKRVLELLQEMQATGTHLAVLVDEYGGTAGIVTVEDIAEELLGSITEEGGVAVVRAQHGGWMVDGSLPVEDLANLMAGDLPEGDWNTVGGMVMGILGRIPQVGDRVEVADHVVRVVAVRRRRVTRVEVLGRR